MGQHWSHLTPTKRIQLDAFIRAGMKPTDIAKELGVHHTTIYRELKRCTYEHLNSDYTTETRYNPDGAQARYEANLRAKGPELKIGNDYELADYLIAKIRDEKYSPEAAIGEAEVKGWPFKTHICASTAYNYIRGEIFGDERKLHVHRFRRGHNRVYDFEELAGHPFHAGADLRLIEDFVDALTRPGHPFLCTIEDSIESHRICFEAERSRRCGETIRLE